MKEISYRKIREVTELYRFVHPDTGREVIRRVVPKGVTIKKKSPLTEERRFSPKIVRSSDGILVILLMALRIVD